MEHQTDHQEHDTGAQLAYQAPYPPLDREVRHSVETGCAAFHLTRSPQTLRIWACRENGPLRPIRVNGRLAWPVADIRRLLGVRK